MSLKVECFEGFVLTCIFLISFCFFGPQRRNRKMLSLFCNLLMSSIIYKCLAFIAHELVGKMHLKMHSVECSLPFDNVMNFHTRPETRFSLSLG